MSAVSLEFPPELVEAIAGSVAEILAEQIPDRPEPYLDVEAAAAYLACQPHRIYDLVSSKRLPVFKDGRRSLFRREDLDAVLRREEGS